MAIKKPIPISFNLDGQYSVQSVCAVIHIDDKNTETLDLSLMQGGEHIAVSHNSTVTARFVRVKDKILISDNVACTVQENGNIHIPIDNAAAHMLVGEIKIEINIVDENDILTMQFPLVIRVNNTILADAEISPESEGTIPELLEEAREAAESATQAAEAATKAISAKQDKLTAGDNITIEGNVISAEGGGVTSYNDLTDKPQINGVTLTGNRTLLDLGTLNFRPSYQNPPTSTSELIETPCIWYNRDDKTAFYLLNVDKTQAPREYRYTWSRFNNRIVVSNEAVPERSPNNTDYEYDVGDIWVQTEMDSNDIKALYICIVKKRVTVNYKTWYFKYTWAPLSQGSAQIVSGVVNANGTITFTDSDGNTFTTTGSSVIGADGFSPSATVQQTASGATVSITDKNGTTTANITNGQDGNDYVLTAQDKSDIADIVLSELPTTQGVLYGNQSN